MGIKADVVKILEPRFGVHIRETIESYYSDDHPEELIELAEHMLTSLIGKKNANGILAQLKSKYP